MHSGSSLSEIVRGELSVRAESAASEFDELLREYDQACRWLATDLPEDLRATLVKERDLRAGRIIACLITWRALGGSIQFSPAGISKSHGLSLVSEVLPVSGETEETAERPPPQEAPPAFEPAVPTAAAPDAPKERVPVARPVVSTSPTRTPWEEQLLELLPDLVPSSADQDEFDRLDALFKRRDDWKESEWPRSALIALLSYLTCRACAIQDRHPNIRGMTGMFQVLGGFRKSMGFDNIHGLARNHEPKSDSWTQDANKHLEDLLSCLRTGAINHGVFRAAVSERKAVWKQTDRRLPEAEIKLDRLRIVIRAAVAGGLTNNTQFVNLVAELEPQLGGPVFRTLRQKIRETQAQRAPAEEELEDDGPTDELERLFADWSHLPHTRGKRAVIFGGTPIRQAQDRIKRAFGFAELEWKDGEFKNGIIENVRATVASGTVDIVLMLRRIVGHNSTKIVDACKDTGTPFVFVDGSCSVTRVKLGIERYLTAPETMDAPSV